MKPTASVSLVTDGTGLNQTKVDAIAHLVARAHPRLEVDQVAVVDATVGRSYQPRGDDEMSGRAHLEQKQATESYLRRTIEEHLDYIPGVRVAVNAQVDSSVAERTRTTYEEPKVGPVEDETRTLSSTNQRRPQEPGVRSNTGVAIGGSGTSSQMNDERSRSRVQPAFGNASERVHDPRGYAMKINATIGVPRSYFVARYRLLEGDPEAEPDEAALTPMITDELARITADIQPLIETDAFDQALQGTVRVSEIADFADLYPGAAAGLMAAADGGLVGGMLSGGVVKYATLGGLAVISLVMMFLMVRKASAPEELPTAEELAGIPPALTDSHNTLVGEADETDPILEGVEIDEGSMERQQMLDQVSGLIRNSPDEAAMLVRKWMKDVM